MAQHVDLPNDTGIFPDVSSAEFIEALALAANGVSIVTTAGSAGQAGLTVSSLCSVCAEPPLMLACVNADNEFCSKAVINGAFAINLLATHHTDLSNRFAGLLEAHTDDRFAFGEWVTVSTGAPVLADALVGIDCAFESSQRHGTHQVFFGRVVGIRSRDGDALVYSQRDYARLVPLVAG